MVIKSQVSFEQICCRCKEESLMQVMLPVAEVTETGKVVFSKETEQQSVQIPVPLCFKCMQFASEGWINLMKVPNKEKYQLIECCDRNSDFSLRKIEEKYKNGELKKDIEETLEKLGKTREEIKKQKMKDTPLRISIIVDEVMNNYEKFKKEVKAKSKMSKEQTTRREK